MSHPTLRRHLLFFFVIALPGLACTRSGAAPAPQNLPALAAWNDGPVQRAILDFVERTTAARPGRSRESHETRRLPR
jgi:hypothetical protein